MNEKQKRAVEAMTNAHERYVAAKMDADTARSNAHAAGISLERAQKAYSEARAAMLEAFPERIAP